MRKENVMAALRIPGRPLLMGLLCLPAILALFVTYVSAPVQAANGDNLRTIIADRFGTDCVSVNTAGDHDGVGVGIAFNGLNLLISCSDDNSITVINPANGSQVSRH